MGFSARPADAFPVSSGADLTMVGGSAGGPSTNDVLADFRALADPKPIAMVLGGLVDREVDRYRAQRLKTSQLDDQELLDTLDRARELHDNLATIVDRLERRLDRQAPAPGDPGR